jgi:vitamin B12 transporter
MKKSFLIFCVFAMSETLRAQDSTMVDSINEVTITATRQEKNIYETGRSISLITNADIKASGAKSVMELLSMQEGLYIVGSTQNPGSLGGLFMRGANNNQTVIMIDGVRITDVSSVNNTIDLSELSLSGIDRIEIVRGSHSTMYGSSAIGGVVNIITKKADANPGFHMEGSLLGGVYEENGSILSENLFLNYTHKSGFYVDAGVLNTNASGFNSTVDTVTLSTTYKHPDLGDDHHALDLNGKLGYKNGKWNAFLAYKHFASLTDIDKGAFRDDDNYSIDVTRNLFSYNLRYKFNDKLSITVNGGMSKLNRKAVDDSSIIDNAGNYDQNYFSYDYIGETSSHDLQLNYKGKNWNVLLGGGLNTEAMNGETFSHSPFGDLTFDSMEVDNSITNVFLHTDLDGKLVTEKLDRFSLGLGARFVNHSDFGSAVTYEINPSFKIGTKGLLYFSYSTGFNAPSLYQLYSPEKDFSSGISRGNPSLKPETSASFEIGVKQKINEDITWSACYFHTVVENTIEYVYLWDKDTDIDSLSYLDYHGDTYFNAGKQTTRGAEFSLWAKMSEKWSVNVGMGVAHGRLEYDPAGSDTTHIGNNHVQLFNSGAFLNKKSEVLGLSRRPSVANFSVLWKPVKGLQIKGSLRLVSATTDVYYEFAIAPFGALAQEAVKDYTLVDLSVRYEMKKYLSFMVKADNIFDERYSEIRGYASRGRGFYAGITGTF